MTADQNDSDRATTNIETLRDYLDATVGAGTGVLFVGTKGNGQPFRQTTFTWPHENDLAMAEILKAATLFDVYMCPYLMRTADRTKGNAVTRLLVHSDVDNGALDIERVRALKGFAIASGSPGNGHAYVALSERVSAEQHEALCRGLGRYLGAVDAKISDNDYLRPPGTLNHKPTINGGDPVPVESLVPWDGTRVDPNTLAGLLGVTLGRPATNGQVCEPVTLDNYPDVLHAFKTNTGDRSVDTMRIVSSCYDAYLTLPQARWVVSQRTDLAGRLDERRDDDVDTCWRKIDYDRRSHLDIRGSSSLNVATGTDGEAASRSHNVEEHNAAAGSETSSRPAQIHRSQARFAYLLADREADKLLHVHGIGWYYWDARRWTRDNKGKAKRAVLAEVRRQYAKSRHDKDLAADCRKCDTAPGVNGVLELAASLEQFATTVDDLDADPFKFNVANGTLDLHAFELHPHSTADRITKICRGAYDPHADTPVWNAFLARVLPDEDVRAFVQRLAGLALLGEVREHILPIFMGIGRNGKGTLYEALLYAFGDYGGAAEPNLFMHRQNAHPTGEMDLLGKRLVVVSESREGRQIDESTMKRLTGGDRIKARYMHKDFVEFTPSHLPILVTNHLPKVSGDDPAVWARIRVVPFNVVIPEPERDTTLGSQLHLEADGILTWAVNGLRDYLENGLAEPDSVRVATDAYHSRQDSVGRFIEERCHLSPAVRSTTGELYAAWQRWQEADGCEPLGRGTFGDALDRRGFPSAKPVMGKRWRHGISLKGFADDED